MKNNSEFIIFKTEDETISVDVRMNEQDVWLTQDQLAMLYGVERPGITQHIKNIFAEGELQENSVSKKFLRTAADGKVQNKIHYAVHRQTAAEVIFTRSDAEKEFMGLMTFPGNRPHLKDVVIAKNYLVEKELRVLGQIVSGYLDFAERQAEREQSMKMEDWATHLDRILTMSGENLLQGAGTISHIQAVEKATTEYKKYQQTTLSEAEKNYLESLKAIEQKMRKK